MHCLHVDDAHETELGFELYNGSTQYVSNFPSTGSFFSNSLQLDLVFPIPLLQGLMTSTRKKIGLAVVFGMGIITIAVSIGRFVTMLYVHNDISICKFPQLMHTFD